MRRMKVSPAVEAIAALVEPLSPAAPDLNGRSIQAVAAAVSPAVFPTEQYRKDTKAMLLREMQRPKSTPTAGAGSQDGVDGGRRNVIAVEGDGSQITFADMEEISPEQAAIAAESIARIVARHGSRIKHS